MYTLKNLENEIERAYKALEPIKASIQNETDIREWFESGRITAEEKRELRNLNNDYFAVFGR